MVKLPDTLGPPSGPTFSVGSLWYDEAVRGVAIQILVLLGVFALVAWMIGNVVANFAILDKTFGFDFLWRLPANYDINQTLIPYSNRDTHLRAAVVGLLNTGLVAFLGIILATVLGFLVGILRLLDNWLVSRLAYFYVEFTRNTPVLLLILLWHGILINTLPHPRQAMTVGDIAFLTNRGVYVPKPLFGPGFEWVAVMLVAALVAAFFVHRHVRQVREDTGRQLPGGWMSAGLIVGLPGLTFVAVQASLSFEVPALQGFNFQGGLYLTPELVALTWALAFYTSGFIAENVRAGILAVDKGQIEASQALGLPPGRVLRLVILPQALRVIIPPLTSSYLDLAKNSSLAIAIGYIDLVATLGGITLNQTGREIECMMLVLLVYLSISLSISALMNWYNRRVRLVER
jgi:general L-amino acid transport system permease protein